MEGKRAGTQLRSGRNDLTQRTAKATASRRQLHVMINVHTDLMLLDEAGAMDALAELRPTGGEQMHDEVSTT
jgi:hypothetical protein